MDAVDPASLDEVKRVLIEIWHDVLGVDEVDVDANFYDVGGHSLLAMSIAEQIGAELHVGFSAADVSRLPTIAAQAQAVVEAIASSYDASSSS
jgi:acyl carrier protein